MSIGDLYKEMASCNSCKLRAGCTQVVPGTGKIDSPILMIIGEAPGADEDEQGEPFVGMAGQVLRRALRATGVINRTNTLITNVVHCRPPANKFPTDESASICVGKWLANEILLAKPKRLMLLGNVPLKYVAGMTGITSHRGTWITAMGVRTMPTYHPSYIIRQDGQGDMRTRALWESDILEVAEEVRSLLSGEATS